jgi:hypothetical protein
MGDTDAKADAKPPKSIDGLPKDMQDFLDCKANTLDLTPGKQKWMKNIPEVGGVLEDTDMKFEENKDGSVKATASIYGFDQSVNLKVDGDGNLAIDASDSTLINAFKDNIDGWCKDFNNWLKSKGKKLGKPKVSKRGVVSIAKENAGAAMAPKPGGVKEGGFLPHVPALEKAGAVLVFGASLVAGIGLLPSDSTKAVASTQVIAVAQTQTQTPTSARTVTTEKPPATTIAPIIGDACIGVNHAVPGQYSFLQFYFTTYPQYAGPWMFQLAQTPTGPLAGIGESDKTGHGQVDVKIFQFGTYNGLVIRGPGNTTVPSGPFASMLPFTVTQQPKTCDANALKVPTLGTTNPTPTQTPTAHTEAPQASTTTVTQLKSVHKDAGPPWSLAIPIGTAGMLGGALYLDEKRRRECAEDDDDDDDEGGEPLLVRPGMFVDTGEHPVVPPEKFADTKVEPPDLPPVENLQDPPRKIDPDEVM